MKHFLLITVLLLVLAAACTSTPTPTPVPPMATPVPPTQTPVLPTVTSLPPTSTPTPPTSTPLPTTTATTTPAPQQDKAKVVIYDMSSRPDIPSLQMLSTELGFSFDEVDYNFINDRTKWFDQSGNRKVDLFIIAGGHQSDFFARGQNPGINLAGCRNLEDFISQGGSAIGLDGSGIGVYANSDTFVGLSEEEAKRGVKWAPLQHTNPGMMVQVCGGEPLFKGDAIGPLESNRPYPRVRFIPIKVNSNHAIIKQAKVPDTIFVANEAGSDMFPDKSQPMEEVAWWPDGAVAIGIVQYGRGNVYLIGPHPDLTMERNHDYMVNVMKGPEADRMGVPADMRAESVAILEKEGDPDGGTPDLALMKALLNDAASRAISNKSVSAPATP